MVIGIQVAPTQRTPRLSGPLVDLSTNSNCFVAPEITEIFCVDLPNLSCHASIV
jgi:hypothetical protein